MNSALGFRELWRIDHHKASVSLAGALKILRLFHTPGAVPLSTVCLSTGLSLREARRLIVQLQLLGFLEVGFDEAIAPTLQTLTLGFAARPTTLVTLARRPLEKLAIETGGTISLGSLVGDRVLFLIRIRNSDKVSANIEEGSTISAADSVIGQMLLAGLPPSELRDVLEHSIRHPPPIDRQNELSMVDNRVRLIRRIRATGYNVGSGGTLHSISVPVTAPDGRLVAAINLAVVAPLNRPNSHQRLLSEVQSTAREVSGRIAMSWLDL